MTLKIIVRIVLLLTLSIYIYYFYLGILNPIPALGDSWDYHIPIAKMILSGEFIKPSSVGMPQWYYPGSSELFHSLFLFFHIPLTLSNIFATIVLFFSLWKLGAVYKLSYYASLLYALTFISLTVVVRWANAVSIDMWVAVFFTLGIILLQNPKKSSLYAVVLGTVLGMLLGSKYLAIIYVLLLSLFFIKELYSVFSFKRFILFLVPFTFFGLFWYIRNAVLLGNPIYPLALFNLPYVPIFNSSETVIQMGILKPSYMINALFSEYKFWTLSICLSLGILLRSFVLRKKYELYGVEKLCLLGLSNAVFFLFFPSYYEEWNMVSSFRYSYPVFIPLILSTFIFMSHINKEEYLGYFIIANIFPALTMSYYPKLLVIYGGIFILCYVLIERFAPREKVLIDEIGILKGQKTFSLPNQMKKKQKYLR